MSMISDGLLLLRDAFRFGLGPCRRRIRL